MDEKRNFTLLTDFYELTIRKRLCDRLWSGTGDRLYQESVLFL